MIIHSEGIGVVALLKGLQLDGVHALLLLSWSVLVVELAAALTRNVGRKIYDSRRVNLITTLEVEVLQTLKAAVYLGCIARTDQGGDHFGVINRPQRDQW